MTIFAITLLIAAAGAPAEEAVKVDPRYLGREIPVADQRDAIALYERVEQLLLRQPWCREVVPNAFEAHIPTVLAIFLLDVTTVTGEKETVWGIAGDLPTVYLDDRSVRSLTDALEAYTGEMQAWVDAIRSGADRSDIFPVEAAPTLQNADDLERRLDFIEEKILPELRDDTPRR